MDHAMSIISMDGKMDTTPLTNVSQRFFFSIPLLLTATKPPIRNTSATIIIVYACRNGKKLEHNTSKMPVPSIQAKYSKALSIRGFFSKPLSSLAT